MRQSVGFLLEGGVVGWEGPPALGPPHWQDAESAPFASLGVGCGVYPLWKK